MNKVALVEKLAGKLEVTKKEAEQTVNTLLESIQEILVEDGKLQLTGFGTFEVRDRAAREGHNPQTGEKLHIPATKVPAFKAGKKLKEAVK